MSDKENNKLKVEVGTTNDPTMIKKSDSKEEHQNISRSKDE